MTKKGEPDARYSDNPKYTRFKRCTFSIHDLNIRFHTTSFKAVYNFQKGLEELIKGDLKEAVARYMADEKAEKQLKEAEASKPSIYDPRVRLKLYMSEDSLFLDAVKFVVADNNGSTSALQRKFSIGYNRAGRMIDWMEDLGFVSISRGGLSREVKVDMDYVNFLLNEDNPSYTDNSVPSTKSKHKVGDKHPTKPWVWTEYTPGKFDWRKDKDASGEPDQTKSPSTKDVSKELDSLIGMASVKGEIAKLQNFIKIQLVRKSQGLKTSPISYHCVFTGNPGTGKTTVARIIAQIYKDLGILSKGHLVETDRSGLVAEYVGQTAVKTNKIIDSALDGVLFIDEAYSLVQGYSNDFGLEAISTLLKRMEDDRERLVVILAGYGDEMKTFIDSNPGLQSRFNRYIHFDDYSADELFEIFLLNAKKNQYVLTDDAKQALRSKIDAAVANKDKNFGNARTIRNMFEKTLEHQATRLTAEGVLDKDALQRITSDDINNL